MTRRFRHGLVLGKFYPLHAGHLNLIRTGLRSCDALTVEVLVSSVESIPASVRADWIRAEAPQARVVHAVDDTPVDYGSDAAWDTHLAVITSLLDEPVDAVFTSDAYGVELADRLDAQWVRVDPARQEVPVSGTAVRADPHRHWWALPAPVRAYLTTRVVVLGAESTGTTTLARDLTAHYGTPEVPEFGRTWSEIRPGGLSAPWHSSEFDLVATEQARLEDAAAARTPRPLLIADTDVLATTVWHERYVGAASPSVTALAARRRPDLYLLTGDEIGFVQDGLRDGEHLRHAMSARFREVLDGSGVPWHELRGSPAGRLAAAVDLVDALDHGRRLADPLPQAGTDAHRAGSRTRR
ncbi:AAA family ATPase [Occultella aeris]|uniref:Trifunctional NAD biosynthesis/regulator protein NadR n=1 Tax=Occultella aeris TaxID=2761496 RepID=A0A7M4DSR0_9MICO|nr:AAA family ATPase [Occultella aeris]VZO40504.1 Trifunctional NAD biosynthesis/regulator protein NadR [Occultella aeris]